MTGSRKLKAFYATLIALMFVFGTAVFNHIPLSGDNIESISLFILGTGGAFMGSNFGEHWAAAKKPNGSV